MGQGVEINDGKIVNKNPATGEVISRVPCTTLEELDKIVQTAKLAAPGWAAMEASERIDLLKKGLKELSKEASKLQEMITKEMGKPAEEAADEVEGAVGKDEFFEILESALKPKKHGSCLVVRQPLGIVAVMSPWNFPADEILYLVLPSLGSGNTGKLEVLVDSGQES